MYNAPPLVKLHELDSLRDAAAKHAEAHLPLACEKLVCATIGLHLMVSSSPNMTAPQLTSLILFT